MTGIGRDNSQSRNQNSSVADYGSYADGKSCDLFLYSSRQVGTNRSLTPTFTKHKESSSMLQVLQHQPTPTVVKPLEEPTPKVT
mmetsp:Transcript_3971/g.2937  ORF Transcript_3971/g.2937 Transcript_3971/m.2937 type:complete len:84 (+) Transcript_3971:132-383(+)